MKFQMRLCSKRLLDVEIEANDEKEALQKGQEMLKQGMKEKGVMGKGATQIEWIETETFSGSTFGRLPSSGVREGIK